MRPPALEIRLILTSPTSGWHFVCRKFGEPIAASDEPFEQPGLALRAAVQAVKNLRRQKSDDEEGY